MTGPVLGGNVKSEGCCHGYGGGTSGLELLKCDGVMCWGNVGGEGCCHGNGWSLPVWNYSSVTGSGVGGMF